MKVRLTPTPARSVGPPGARDRRNPALSTRMALALILSMYALFYGRGIFLAVTDVGGGSGREDYTRPFEQSMLVVIVAEIALAITLYAVICRWLYVPRALAGLPRRRRQGLWAGQRPVLPPLLTPTVYTLLFSAIALYGSSELLNWLQSGGGDQGTTIDTNGALALNWPSLALGGWIRSVNAGVVEEIVIVALPVILGRRAGWHPAAIIGLSVLMRIPFHLYHGWAAIPWAIVWAGTNVVLFLYLRRLLPLIAVHAGVDLVVFYRETTVGVLTVLALLIGAIIVTIVRAVRVLRRYERTVTVDGHTIRHRRVPTGNVNPRDNGKNLKSVRPLIDAIRADVGPTRHGTIRLVRGRNHPHAQELAAAGYPWQRWKLYRIPLDARHSPRMVASTVAGTGDRAGL